MMLLGTASRVAARSTQICAACHQTQRRAAHKLVEVELLTDVPALGRRGEKLAVSPGLARNRLIPNGQGLYVVKGQGYSPLRDMMAREARLRAASLRRPAGAMSARKVLDNLTEQTPQDAQRVAEGTLANSLTLLPQPLIFSRLTHTTSTSHRANELFGSVSVADVVAELKDFGIRIEESQCAFAEAEGVEKGRVKTLGDFKFDVQLRALNRTEKVSVRVTKETKE